MSTKKKSGKKSKRIVGNMCKTTAWLRTLDALMRLIDTALRFWGG